MTLWGPAWPKHRRNWRGFNGLPPDTRALSSNLHIPFKGFSWASPILCASKKETEGHGHGHEAGANAEVPHDLDLGRAPGNARVQGRAPRRLSQAHRVRAA